MFTCASVSEKLTSLVRQFGAGGRNMCRTMRELGFVYKLFIFVSV